MCVVAATSREDWETFEFDVDAWRGVLDELGCDPPSRMALFTLAQHTKQAAAEVMWKVVKKICDNTQFENPSGFLHKAVKNAWHRIAPWAGANR